MYKILLSLSLLSTAVFAAESSAITIELTPLDTTKTEKTAEIFLYEIDTSSEGLQSHFTKRILDETSSPLDIENPDAVRYNEIIANLFLDLQENPLHILFLKQDTEITTVVQNLLIDSGANKKNALGPVEMTYQSMLKKLNDTRQAVMALLDKIYETMPEEFVTDPTAPVSLQTKAG